MIKLQGNHELKRTSIYSFHTNKEENIDYEIPIRLREAQREEKINKEEK